MGVKRIATLRERICPPVASCSFVSTERSSSDGNIVAFCRTNRDVHTQTHPTPCSSAWGVYTKYFRSERTRTPEGVWRSHQRRAAYTPLRSKNIHVLCRTVRRGARREPSCQRILVALVSQTFVDKSEARQCSYAGTWQPCTCPTRNTNMPATHRRFHFRSTIACWTQTNLSVLRVEPRACADVGVRG